MNPKPTITFKQLSDLADIFSEGENIDGVPNEADLEMERFRVAYQSVHVRCHDGYMVYSTHSPATMAAKANKIIEKLWLRLKATPSMIDYKFTVQYIGNGK